MSLEATKALVADLIADRQQRRVAALDAMRARHAAEQERAKAELDARQADEIRAAGDCHAAEDAAANAALAELQAV